MKPCQCECTKIPEPSGEEIIKITIVGLLHTVYFQKAKFYATQFAKRFNKFQEPDIKGFLDFEWNEFLLNCKRTFGKKYYDLKHPVVTYINDKFLGDDDDLKRYLTENFQISIPFDLYDEALKDLRRYTEEQNCTHVFMLIVINSKVAGPLIFKLYNNIVPKACENFVRLLTKKKNGLRGSRIHRICKPSWIQGGGCGNIVHKRSQHDENYIVPHNKRGVLSMCNNGKDCDNAVQFNITLNPADWMDNKYVAFGQLIIGDEVLSKIEAVDTYYEYPLQNICIADAGLYTFDQTISKREQYYLDCFLKKGNEQGYGHLIQEFKDKRDLPSKFEIRKYVAGLYSFYLDQGPMNWPHRILSSNEMLELEELQNFLKKKKLKEYYPSDELDTRDVPSQLSVSQFEGGYYYFPLDDPKVSNLDEVSIPKTHLGLYV